MDKIHIKDLALRGIIGVYDHERTQLQDITVNVVLHTDLSRAGKTDNFEDTVDYKSVKQSIAKLVESSQFFLVEALAEAIAGLCLEFDKVQQVDVLVEKPGALKLARTVGVEISRTKV